ncbi:MAG TPA: hypothetical protein VGI45_08035 [Terracidiphilus sp.]
MREELVRRSVEEIAKKINRSPKSIRCMLRRNNLRVRDIRCDILSLESLARALRIRKAEILFWIGQGWLEAAICTQGKKHSYSITPDALAQLYKHHLFDLLKRGIPNWSLFEAYVQYVHTPKHTVGEQLLDVRRDKRERAAFAETEEHKQQQRGMRPEEEDDDDECAKEYRTGSDAAAQEIQSVPSE